MRSGIYAIRCLANRRVYVGSAVNIDARWATHACELRSGKHNNKILQRAWDKYGEEEFEFSILQDCQPQHLLEDEQDEMERYRSTDRAFGFNICPNAGNTLGRKHGPEAKEKMSYAAKRRTNSPESNAKRSATQKGRKQSPEHVAKRAASRSGKPGTCKGRKQSPEHIAKRSAAMIGKNLGRKRNSGPQAQCTTPSQ